MISALLFFAQLGKKDRYKSTVFIDTFITRFGDLTGSIFVGIGKFAAISISIVPLLAIPFAGLFSFTGYKISKIFNNQPKDI